MPQEHSQTALSIERAAFIRALREFRVAENKSQRWLALTLGVSRAEYKQYESGAGDIPDSFIAHVLKHYDCADIRQMAQKAKMLPLPHYDMNYRKEDFVQAWIRLRLARNLTCDKLAEIIEADKKNLSQLEQNYGYPGRKITDRIVRALGFDSPQALIAASEQVPAVSRDKESIDQEAFARALIRHNEASGRLKKDLCAEFGCGKNALTDCENGVRLVSLTVMSRILTYYGASNVEQFIANAAHLTPMPALKRSFQEERRERRQTMEAILGLCQFKGIGSNEISRRLRIPVEHAQACLRGDSTLNAALMKKLPQAMGYSAHEAMMSEAENHPLVDYHAIIEATRELCLEARMTTRQLADKLGVEATMFRRQASPLVVSRLSAQKLASLPGIFNCTSFTQMVERAAQSLEHQQRLRIGFAGAPKQSGATPVRIEINLAEKQLDRILGDIAKPSSIRNESLGWQNRLRGLADEAARFRKI